MIVNLLCEVIPRGGDAQLTVAQWMPFEVDHHQLRLAGSLSLPLLASFSGDVDLAMRRRPEEAAFLTVPLTLVHPHLTAGDSLNLDTVNMQVPDLRIDVLLGAAAIQTYDEWLATTSIPTLESAFAAGFINGSATTHALAQEAND